MPPPKTTGEPHSLKLSEPIPLTRHPAAVYLDSLAPGSLPTMRQALNAIASLLTNNECDALGLDWAKLRYQHTSAIRTALKKNYAPSTVNKMLCALRRVLKEALRLDLIDPNDYAKAVDLGTIKDKRKIRGRALTRDEIADLLDVCIDDSSPQGARDAALIGILRGAGLRRAEVASLELKDFNPETGALEVHRGKGGKDRSVYIPESAIAWVKSWIEVRGDAPGALLCPIRKGGEIQLRQMCPDAVLKIVRRRALQAGVESFSPHDFRRTFCSDLLDAGIDIVTVQKLAGHASPVTTAQYDRRGEETKRLAVQKLGF
ncbi:MAG: tyrosine-type recombinase/integrase [Symploca sp. SIO2E9]|nr:tyrosine-type recombinase/integrase [Symploca sp. SIO2E9]